MSKPTKAAEGVLAWGVEGIDHNTCAQAAQTALMPFVQGHIALMPDAHFGLGSTIGSVIPTRGAIIPAAIGVDIGCGMCAAKLNISGDELPDDLGGLHSRIEQSIPAGVGKGHDGKAPSTRFHKFWTETNSFTEFDDRQTCKVFDQFGSLGSGNHFVEVCIDEGGGVWVVLHSGSRGIGNQLARFHIDRAKHLMQEWFISIPNPDLAYLVEGSLEFDAYISDMLWAQDYALLSREEMMDAVLGCIAEELGVSVGLQESRINCHHNYTVREQHHGKSVWLTRKGAIRARSGDLGVIPGSMGTSTYVVRGLGNDAAYHSCSHGAGRKMSRRQAKKMFDADSLTAAMGGRSWDRGRAAKLVDEHPGAYKDIATVMDAQSDLVDVVHTLEAVLNYKGT